MRALSARETCRPSTEQNQSRVSSFSVFGTANIHGLPCVLSHSPHQRSTIGVTKGADRIIVKSPGNAPAFRHGPASCTEGRTFVDSVPVGSTFRAPTSKHPLRT